MYTGNSNVAAGAIDIDSPEFAAKFGGAVGEEDQEMPNYDAPADFDPVANAPAKPKRATKGSTSKPKQTPAQKARADAKKAKDAEAAKAKKAAEAAAKKEAREAERAAKKAEREAAKAAGPDLTGFVPTKVTQKATVQNVPLELLDGIDGGDPVEKSFVENVRLNGVLQPIRVRATEDGRFNIVYGKRRSQAARANGFATIPAVVEKDATTNDYTQGLAENYARSNNVIEEHRMVMGAIDGWKELHGDAGADDRKAVAAISKATGMSVAQIKKARKVGDLVPELVQAVEEGAMSSWSALHAARMPVEVQRRLVETLESEGKVTAEDVVIARRHRQHEAVAAIAGETGGMFDVPTTEVDGDESAAPVAVPGTRTEKVAAAVRAARQGLDLLTSLSAKSDDEQDAITLFTQIIENLTTPA